MSQVIIYANIIFELLKKTGFFLWASYTFQWDFLHKADQTVELLTRPAGISGSMTYLILIFMNAVILEVTLKIGSAKSREAMYSSAAEHYKTVQSRSKQCIAIPSSSKQFPTVLTNASE